MNALFGILAVLSAALGLFTLTSDLPKFNKSCWISAVLCSIISIII